MSDSQYMVVFGRVAFDPQEREVSGKQVVDITVKSAPKQTLVRLTIWPDVEGGNTIEKGDFIATEGKFSTSTGNNGQTYYNLSVTDIAVLKPLPKATRDVVNSGSTTASSDPDDSPF